MKEKTTANDESVFCRPSSIDNNEPLNTSILSFLDVETTGLSARNNDKICEIAIYRGPLYGKMTPWQTLINPLYPISPGASMVNNITDEMVAQAPTFDKVIPEIYSRLTNTIVICHNASFDLEFLVAEFKTFGAELPRFQVIDTLRIARNYFDFPSNNLGKIANYLGIEMSGAHRALADVLTTYHIFNYFIASLSKKGIEIEQLILP